jgi:short subunit dehydrogenase-like uncharacterized protein
MSWGIYGASGLTGSLIVEEARARGHRPTLIGRSEATLRPIAERWNLPWRVAAAIPSRPESRGERTALDAAIADLAVVVNVAAPFPLTVPPLLDACVRRGVSYLDLSNEFETVAHAYSLHDEAREAGIMVVPGVGFGTVAGNAVLRRVSESLPGAAVLEVALLADNARGGRATRDSVLAVLASGAAWHRSGSTRHARLGVGVRRIATPVGTRSVVPIATGDLAAAVRTTAVDLSEERSVGIAATRVISASVALAAPAPLLRLVLPVLGATLRTGVPQWIVRRTDAAARSLAGQLPARAGSGPTPPTAHDTVPRIRSSHAWARATRRDGRTATAWLDTGEGYAFSASAAVSAVERVLAGIKPGAWTPSQAFGGDFVLSVPGTRLRLLDGNEEYDASSQS